MPSIPECTVEQMRQVDELMEGEFSVSPLQLMELAGFVTARAAMDLFRPSRVLVLAGKGNNGGDGMAAARHLHCMGVRVQVRLAGDVHRELPALQLEALNKLKIQVEDKPLFQPDLIIDALLGYGAEGEPGGGAALLIHDARRLCVPVLSVDVPSGLDVSAGKWFEPCFREATVLTLGLPKKGMKKDSGIKRLLVGDIGIPPECYQRIGINAHHMFRKGCYEEIKG